MEVEQHCRIIFKNYFYLVYERYGIPIPDEADWSHPQLPANVPWLIAVEVPRMLMEFGEINEDTRIPAMMELCEYFSGHINESNFLEMYSTTMDILLNSSHNPRFNHDPFLGKMQVFCIFSAAYCIYLYKHNINDWATKEIYKTAQKIFQDRFKFWLDYHHSWVSCKLILTVMITALFFRKCSWLKEGEC